MQEGVSSFGRPSGMVDEVYGGLLTEWWRTNEIETTSFYQSSLNLCKSTDWCSNTSIHPCIEQPLPLSVYLSTRSLLFRYPMTSAISQSVSQRSRLGCSWREIPTLHHLHLWQILKTDWEFIIQDKDVEICKTLHLLCSIQNFTFICLLLFTFSSTPPDSYYFVP